MSLTPVVHLEPRISPRIFEKIRNGRSGILRISVSESKKTWQSLYSSIHVRPCAGVGCALTPPDSPGTHRHHSGDSRPSFRHGIHPSLTSGAVLRICDYIFTVPILVPTFDKFRFRLLTSSGSDFWQVTVLVPALAPYLDHKMHKNLVFLHCKLFYKERTW